MKVKHIIRLHSIKSAAGTGQSRWLVQLRNGSTALMTAAELLADLRNKR